MEPLNPTTRGFTLVEMLVVMAIIAIISALAVGGWQASQRSARSLACTGHLRQIGTALSRYLSDHDQTFPKLVMARDDKEDKQPALDTELLPYIREKSVFKCPADTAGIAEKTGTSYLWNHKLNGQRLADLSVTFLRGETITDSHKIMVIGDKEGFHSEPDKVNVLYADGHASKELTFVDDMETAE